jgi:hypothetical protein
LNILLRGWSFGNSSSNILRNSRPMFVDTFLLYGGLYQMILLVRFLRLVCNRRLVPQLIVVSTIIYTLLVWGWSFFKRFFVWRYFVKTFVDGFRYVLKYGGWFDLLFTYRIFPLVNASAFDDFFVDAVQYMFADFTDFWLCWINEAACGFVVESSRMERVSLSLYNIIY